MAKAYRTICDKCAAERSVCAKCTKAPYSEEKPQEGEEVAGEEEHNGTSESEEEKAS